MPAQRKTLCLDFDNVIHSYTSGWKGATVIPDPPVPGAFEFIAEAVKVFDVCVLSSRSHELGGREAMACWMVEHCPGLIASRDADGSSTPGRISVWFGSDRITFPLHKPPAFVTIDDRALTFTGKWPTIEALLAFKPWNMGGETIAVVTPFEPTEAMLEAARDWSAKFVGTPIGNAAAIGCWQAMHDAATRVEGRFKPGDTVRVHREDGTTLRVVEDNGADVVLVEWMAGDQVQQDWTARKWLRRA